MQSAKAASSADELLWLRKRQWLVSFAPIGSIEDKHLGDLKKSQCSPAPSKSEWINILQGSRCNSSENQHSAKVVMSIPVWFNIYIHTDQCDFLMKIFDLVQFYNSCSCHWSVLMLWWFYLKRSFLLKKKNYFMNLLLLHKVISLLCCPLLLSQNNLLKNKCENL